VAALPPPQSPTLKFPITELVPRIRAECLEMLASIGPRRKGRWLWGLDGAMCDAALVLRSAFVARERAWPRPSRELRSKRRQARDMSDNDEATTIRGAGRVLWLIGTNDGY
jgi:hypothetical protein